MKTKSAEYFVSYQFSDKNGNSGFGYCSVTTTINTGEDLIRVQKTIEEQFGFEKVIILFYKEM